MTELAVNQGDRIRAWLRDLVPSVALGVPIGAAGGLAGGAAASFIVRNVVPAGTFGRIMRGALTGGVIAGGVLGGDIHGQLGKQGRVNAGISWALAAGSIGAALATATAVTVRHGPLNTARIATGAWVGCAIAGAVMGALGLGTHLRVYYDPVPEPGTFSRPDGDMASS